MKAMARYGDQVPWGDPNWYQGWHSPYYNESHHRFRAAVRAFVEKEMMPHAEEWEAARTFPMEVRRKAYEAGILPGLAANAWPVELCGRNIAGGVKPEEYDAFHSMILGDELSRVGI